MVPAVVCLSSCAGGLTQAEVGMTSDKVGWEAVVVSWCQLLRSAVVADLR